MMVSTIFPITSNTLAGNAGISDVDYLAYWGYAVSISTPAGRTDRPLRWALSQIYKIIRKRSLELLWDLESPGVFFWDSFRPGSGSS